MPEYDAGTVKATMKADGSGLHAGVESAKRDYKSLKDVIVEALTQVKKSENEASKAKEEAARKAREAAQQQKEAARQQKEDMKELSLASGVTFAAIVAGVYKAVQANNQLKSSMLGLDSIAKGTVGTYPKIQAELEKIREDGMIPLTNATATYKNLLSRYKDEDTAIKMFKSIADMAAFNRQAHLSLGEAVQSTSEGLKNELSTLADAGGVTKNISAMWKDYADSVGKSVNKLTEAEKHQAEINGFMEEGKYATGNLSQLQGELAGQMSRVSAMSNEVAIALGSALEPAMTGVAEKTGTLLENIKDIINAAPGLTAGLTVGATAFTGLAGGAGLLGNILPKLVTGFKALFGASSGPVGWGILAFSTLLAVTEGLNTAQKKEIETLKKQSQTLKSETSDIYNLSNEYKDLSGKTKLTREEKERLKTISDKLVELAPDMVIGYDKEGKAILNLNIALEEMVRKKKESLELDKKTLEKQLAKAESELKSAKQMAGTQKTAVGITTTMRTEGLTPEQKAQLGKMQQEGQSLVDQTSAAISKKQGQVDSIKAQIKAIDSETKGTSVGSIKKELEADRQLAEARAKAEKERQEAESKKQSDAEKVKKLAEDRAKALEDMTNREYELTHTETENQKRNIDLQAAEYKKLGISEIEIAKWKAAEIAKINQDQIDKENEIAKRYQEEREADMQRDNELVQQEYEERQSFMDSAKIAAEESAMDEYQITLSRIERERQAEIDRAKELIQNEEDLKQTIADINTNYDSQRLKAMQEQTDQMLEEQKQMYDGEADLLVNLATGTQDITDLFQDMGKQILKNWISTLLQMNAETKSSGLLNILSQFLGFFTGGASGATSSNTVADSLPWSVDTYHTGGIVAPLEAHTGALISDLQNDEVPAILKTKERVLSRNQNEDITGIIKDIKDGNIGGKQNVTNIYNNIQALDGQSVASILAKNHEAVGNALGINYNSNGVSRKLIKAQP